MSARVFAGAVFVVLLSATSWAGTNLPTVTHDGRSYVELSRVAASLHTKLDATPASTRAHLRTRDKTVTFTRNWSQVLVNGKPVVLDAPVRVKQGVWLVPQSFMGRVVPTLVPLLSRFLHSLTSSPWRPDSSGSCNRATDAKGAHFLGIRCKRFHHRNRASAVGPYFLATSWIALLVSPGWRQF